MTSPTRYHKLEVGKPYHPDRKIWPETPTLDYRAGANPELVLFYDSPSRREVESVKSGAAEFALWTDPEGDLIVFCARFGDSVGWVDAPWTSHVIAPADRPTPPDPAELTTESRLLLTTILVNATGGEVRVIRATSLSREFSLAFSEAVRKQAGRPFDRAAYMRSVQVLYAAKTTPQLVAEAVVKCRGGD